MGEAKRHFHISGSRSGRADWIRLIDGMNERHSHNIADLLDGCETSVPGVFAYPSLGEKLGLAKKQEPQGETKPCPWPWGVGPDSPGIVEHSRDSRGDVFSPLDHGAQHLAEGPIA